MEAARSSETVVSYRTTQKTSNLHCGENLRSTSTLCFFYMSKYWNVVKIHITFLFRPCYGHDFSFITLGYGLDDRGLRVQVPAGAGNFSFLHRFQTGSGAHSASYPMGTGSPSAGVKRPGREANHSPPPSAEVKNAWSYTSTPVSLNGMVLRRRDNFTYSLSLWLFLCTLIWSWELLF
jgi:hypothetical protein